MSSLALEIKGLSVKYPSQKEWVLKNVSLSFPQGKVTILVGPNGSGKSTCIKAILGMIPYEGKILFSQDEKGERENSIGYLPQRFLFEKSMPLTVAEFLELALTLCDHSSEEKKELILSALHKVSLEAKMFGLLRDLSGGELQRVLLARALVHNPRLIVLDEPEAGIDLHSEGSLYQLLKNLVKENGVTVVMASHEIHLVPEFADHVVCFHEGMVSEGSPETVMRSDFFAKTYGKSLHFYAHDHDHQNHQAHAVKDTR